MGLLASVSYVFGWEELRRYETGDVTNRLEVLLPFHLAVADE